MSIDMQRATPPGGHHNDIICRRNVQEFVEHIVTTCDDNGGVFLQLGRYVAVEYTRLDLIGDEQEKY